MATSKTQTEPTSEVSPEAQAMIDAGARADTVDVSALMDQIQRLQAQMDAVNAERGIPTDPVAKAAQDLYVHVKARQDSSVELDLKELLTELEKTASDNGVVDEKSVAYITDLVDEAIANHPHRSHDFPYLATLARDLRKAVHNSA